MSKVVKYAEEKKMNKDKKAARSVQRDKKHVAWDDAIVVEEPPQQETKKEFEEDFALYKRTLNPKDPLYQRYGADEKLKEELAELALEDITSPHVTSEEGWESDGDDWFD